MLLLKVSFEHIGLPLLHVLSSLHDLRGEVRGVIVLGHCRGGLHDMRRSGSNDLRSLDGLLLATLLGRTGRSLLLAIVEGLTIRVIIFIGGSYWFIGRFPFGSDVSHCSTYQLLGFT